MKRLWILLLFLSSVGMAQDNSCACCTETHSQFDFWIGTWTVTNSDGSYAGNNTIDKVQDNCILRESWVSAQPGYTGTSHNFFNQQTGEWEQLWIDNKGASLHLKGSFDGKSMVLESDSVMDQNGNLVINKVSWTPRKDGTVRQLWETSTDEKNSWTVVFDGTYTKK